MRDREFISQHDGHLLSFEKWIYLQNTEKWEEVIPSSNKEVIRQNKP